MDRRAQLQKARDRDDLVALFRKAFQDRRKRCSSWLSRMNEDDIAACQSPFGPLDYDGWIGALPIDGIDRPHYRRIAQPACYRCYSLVDFPVGRGKQPGATPPSALSGVFRSFLSM